MQRESRREEQEWMRNAVWSKHQLMYEDRYSFLIYVYGCKYNQTVQRTKQNAYSQGQEEVINLTKDLYTDMM